MKERSPCTSSRPFVTCLLGSIYQNLPCQALNDPGFDPSFAAQSAFLSLQPVPQQQMRPWGPRAQRTHDSWDQLHPPLVSERVYPTLFTNPTEVPTSDPNLLQLGSVGAPNSFTDFTGCPSRTSSRPVCLSLAGLHVGAGGVDHREAGQRPSSGASVWSSARRCGRDAGFFMCFPESPKVCSYGEESRNCFKHVQTKALSERLELLFGDLPFGGVLFNYSFPGKPGLSGPSRSL